MIRGSYARYVLCAVMYASATYASDAGVERRMRIESDILPSVLTAAHVRGKEGLAERMAAWKVPGVSIAVLHEGRIDWARGYGMGKRGSAVTTQTLFQAASISKPIAAFAALHAVQDGKLDLDADVNGYLKAWKIRANRFTDESKVTLRGLLSHTAGVTVHGFPGYAPDAPMPTLLQVLNGAPPANTPAVLVDTRPGTTWRYSGGGYVIVQQLLEDVTSTTFSKYVQDEVLTPLGMKHSTYELADAQGIADVALPYDANGNPLEGAHRYPEAAPAGLWSTPSDLARFVIEVQQTLRGKSGRVLSQAVTRQMLTPGLNNWGLGPHIGGRTQHLYFEHTGANAGYRCHLVAYENGEGAIIMTNSENGRRLVAEILQTIAHEYAWPDFQPTQSNENPAH